ncbi:hypothetical protein LWI28_020832 [Acer negundo]|uniref:Cellulose synthase-like protein E6 n=1 Tax=Acer negundo TaxID=4023 RepID=A0AAD5J835_ACENE|nr:hypothetical protein LWI28_020832 [Acer negundo]
MAAICATWLYRIQQLISDQGGGSWACIGMFMAELWFSFYWINQPVRFKVCRHSTFKERLLTRYEDKLPGVDIFVCTADPVMEPSIMVINTVLSAMSFNYPPDKLSVYLSDDGGSPFTFYVLLEASNFSKYWLPFCKKFIVEPRNPEAYFAQVINGNADHSQELLDTKDMKTRIESAIAKGSISKEIRDEHNGFSEWNDEVTKQNHQSIVQIIIDGRGTNAAEIEGCQLPTLVYMAREKRPGWSHNFKAGAMNSLMGLIYGCAVEDVVTGLTIQCRGWKYQAFGSYHLHVFIASSVHSLIEAMNCGSTVKIWWNLERMWMIRRTTVFLFRFINVIIKQLGLSQTAFALTSKVVEEDVSIRFELEIIEFGSSSIMFTLLGSLTMMNLFCLVGATLKMVVLQNFGALGNLISQVFLCGMMVLINFPVYQAMFFKKDKGSLQFYVVFKSLVVASLACLIMPLI